jgi:hypothetical protein
MSKVYYKVRYAKKLIKLVLADSKWHAIEQVYSQNKEHYPWIERSKFSAVINDARSSKSYWRTR